MTVLICYMSNQNALVQCVTKMHWYCIYTFSLCSLYIENNCLKWRSDFITNSCGMPLHWDPIGILYIISPLTTNQPGVDSDVYSMLSGRSWLSGVSAVIQDERIIRIKPQQTKSAIISSINNISIYMDIPFRIHIYCLVSVTLITTINNVC